MAIKLPKVSGYDNRGSEEVPLGFVYFDDDVRVGYSPGSEREIWPGNWGTVEMWHLEAARDFLATKGILVKL